MVINMTLGFVNPARGSCFAGTGLVGIACAKAVTPRTGMITIKKKVDKKVEKRPNMPLLRRRLLSRAPRLLVCLRRESLGGQCLGQRLVHDGLLRRQLHGAPQLRNGVVKLVLVEQGLAQDAMSA